MVNSIDIIKSFCCILIIESHIGIIASHTSNIIPG